MIRRIAEDAVRRAVAHGATSADVLIKEDDTFSVTVRMGQVETLKQAITRGMLLRVFVGKRTATSNTSELSANVVDRLVDETVEMAKLTSPDESGGLPQSDLFQKNLPDLGLLDKSWESISPQDRIDMAVKAEGAALKTDKRITNSEGGVFDYSRSRTVVANTAGFADEYEGTGAALSVAPIAQSSEGMQRDYWVTASRHTAKLETPEAVGRKAAERALRRLDARKISTCDVPVIFDPLTAASLLGHVFQAVSGDSIYRRSSFLVGELGQKVAAANVTILDDGRMQGGLGSAPFDDEGVPTGTTVVVDQGVLRSHLHSAYSARKLKETPTGNGSRTASGAVTIGPTNFYLRAGSHTSDEIIASVDAGLYVVELIGFGVNGVTGDYSRGAVGLWIEKGRLSHSVHEITIAGNLKAMLQNVEMIGNDLTFLGSIAAPTIKIAKMVVSGD